MKPKSRLIPMHQLKAYRESKGIALGDFAAQCGLSQPTVSSIESGRVFPSLDSFLAIHVNTGIPLPQLALMMAPNYEEILRVNR